MTDTAILLMAYGGPRRIGDVSAYYTHIRRGDPPPATLLDELIARYRAIGGGSPLSGIVETQRVALADELRRRGHDVTVRAAMKHIAPFITDVVRELSLGGIRRVVAIALAPQGSGHNDETYGRAVTDAAAALAERAPACTVVGSWHDQPRLIEAMAAATVEALARCDDPTRAHVLFTAHSLPARSDGGTERYAHEVAATAALVAERLDIERCDVAFQSAGRTAGRWIGPELRDEIRRLAAAGTREVVVTPVGFVADHLEVLYDIDIEARAVADGLGVRLERARAMNDDPVFIAALADVAEAALAAPVAA